MLFYFDFIMRDYCLPFWGAVIILCMHGYQEKITFTMILEGEGFETKRNVSDVLFKIINCMIIN